MNGKIIMKEIRSSLIGFIITILTPLISTCTVTELEQLSDLRFGFPFRFISQQSWLTPFEEDFPLKLHIGLPQENPTRILIGNFILSFVSITLILLLVNVLWSVISRRRNMAASTDRK